jgi:hypothetical protein
VASRRPGPGLSGSAGSAGTRPAPRSSSLARQRRAAPMPAHRYSPLHSRRTQRLAARGTTRGPSGTDRAPAVDMREPDATLHQQRVELAGRHPRRCQARASRYCCQAKRLDASGTCTRWSRATAHRPPARRAGSASAPEGLRIVVERLDHHAPGPEYTSSARGRPRESVRRTRTRGPSSTTSQRSRRRARR